MHLPEFRLEGLCRDSRCFQFSKMVQVHLFRNFSAVATFLTLSVRSGARRRHRCSSKIPASIRSQFRSDCVCPSQLAQRSRVFVAQADARR